MTTWRGEFTRARPIRCSTVTPGKLATFCRRPVKRLKRVDLPEFGGPTIATTWGFVPDCGPPSSSSVESVVAPVWQSLMRLCRSPQAAAHFYGHEGEMQSHDGVLLRSRPRGTRADHRPEHCAREQPRVQAESRAPSIVWRCLRGRPGDPERPLLRTKVGQSRG